VKSKSLILIFALLMVAAGFAGAEPFAIIIVTDDDKSERGYTEFLQDIYRGNVNVQINDHRYNEDLSNNKKLELESADLIIVSRDTGSKDYNGDSEFWGEINVPILNHNIKLARSGGHKFWDWLEGDCTSTNLLTHISVADSNDVIFDGVDISSGTVEIFATGKKIDHSDQNSAGNGTAAAVSDANVVIARWLGSEPSYYQDSNYAPYAQRVFFAMPKNTYKFFDDATDDAKLMLENAILSLLPIVRPQGDLDYDRDVDFDDYVIFSGYWGNSGCTEGVPCCEADFTGDANVAGDDLKVLAGNWLEGVDLVVPEPNVMTWEDEPVTVSTTSVSMAATAASDSENGVEYYFQCASGNGPDSGWQYNTLFEPNNLAPGTKYTYRAKARDTSSRLNETEWSSPVTVRTFDIYSEIADASAAAAIDVNLFIAAGDEGSRLCIYDSNNAGTGPIDYTDVNELLNIDPCHPETDIEGATWFNCSDGNDRIFWITSHGRNKDGKYWYSRYQFFATTVMRDGNDINVKVNGNYTNLVDDLIAYDSVYDLGLVDAIGVDGGHIDPCTISELAPKEKGLNIEGLSMTADGNSILIGFRNPRPKIDGDHMALIIKLNNPEEVVLSGAAADFDPPIFLDPNDGFGIRSIEYSPTLGQYLLIAGSHKAGTAKPIEEHGTQVLYMCDMDSAVLTELRRFRPITPEALFQFPDSNDIHLLSDDGILEIDTPEGPVWNKLLPREERTFRRQIVTP